MKATTVFQVLTLSALVIASWCAGERLNSGASSLARPQAIITITQPDGVDDVVGEGDDFATTVLGDPWDMNQQTDVLALHGLPGATISNGILRYTSQSSASEVPLLCRGLVGAMDVGKIGVNYPIDTDRYRWLSFRIMQPAGSSIQIRWHYAKSSTPYAVAQHIPVTTSDWHTYVIDLETVPKGNGDGATDWEGQVLGLYIVSFVSPGSQVSIDWVRLTADNPTGNSLSIAWSGLDSAGATVNFYLDSDQTDCDGALIHTEENASARGSFTWQQPSSGVASPSNVAPGDYYVCATVNGELAGYSAGLLTVNRAPVINFMALW